MVLSRPAGTVDVFALQHHDKYTKTGSDESIQRAVGKLYLQTFISEVKLAEMTGWSK
jgi:hypothetical protein